MAFFSPKKLHSLSSFCEDWLWSFSSILGRLGGFQLELQAVGNQGDELTVGGLSLGIADGVAEEALQGVQVAPVPGYLDGVADGPLYPAGSGLEGFGYLGVEDLAGLRPATGASSRNRIDCLVYCPVDLLSIGLHI